MEVGRRGRAEVLASEVNIDSKTKMSSGEVKNPMQRAGRIGAASEFTGPSARKIRGPQDDNLLLEEKLFRCRLWLELMMFIPLPAQVSPRRIDRNDQGNLLDSQPALYSFLAFDRVVNILEALKICKAIELVFRGEAGTSSRFVFAHSANEIVRNARVERFRPVGHDVDEICSGGVHRRDSVRLLKDGGVAVPVSVTNEHSFPQQRFVIQSGVLCREGPVYSAGSIGAAGECMGPSARNVRGPQDDRVLG
jgi:hypothetical protein